MIKKNNDIIINVKHCFAVVFDNFIQTLSFYLIIKLGSHAVFFIVFGPHQLP